MPEIKDGQYLSTKLADIAEYVKAELDNPYSSKIGPAALIKYDRFEHTLRVYKWMQVLYEAYPEKESVDFEALSIATLFHDIGYGKAASKEGLRQHTASGALIARRYLEKTALDSDKVEVICALIGSHSDKHLMDSDAISHELLLLMEADLLDDTGAQELAMDAWIEVVRDPENVTFDSILKHMTDFSLRHMKAPNPMRTAKGRELWESKQEIARAFVAHYAEDLRRPEFD